jgi:LuxR family transcriptional regulator, maltose regulon positive regulatory protein
MAGLEDGDSGAGAPEVDPQGDPYLRTRFAIPARPATFLRRERLVAHLDQALTTPLTMVCGPAGSGKTLLVAGWAAEREPSVAWFTGEAADQGPGIFWAYLLRALRVSGAPPPPAVGSPPDATHVPRALLARLAAGLSARDRPVTLVLDEYDQVRDPETAEQLEFVLHHAGGGLRLVLVTRTEPLLPLHRYRAAGRLTEIREAELAFTPQEAAALLDAHGLSLSPPAVHALMERTRGWAAGLRLCALAAQGSADPQTYLKEFEADRTPVADFLLAEVLKRQPPAVQDLLLRVSVLERFCPELVNALTGRNDAEPLLAGLHRENAFVEDLGHRWYRLHPLFGEILRVHLRVRSPGLEPELHRRAARWLRRAGFLMESLGHGAAAGDWKVTAGALVDGLAIGGLLTGPRSDDLAELFSGMGPEADGPATDLVRAALALSRGDLGRGLAHLRHAERSLAEQGSAGDDPVPAAARLSCALLEAAAARLSGSPDWAGAAAEEAGKARAQVPGVVLDKRPELVALPLRDLGSTRLWAGHFEQARAALEEAAGCDGGASTAPLRADCQGRLALIDYLDGRLGRAERRAGAALTGTDGFGPPRLPGSGITRAVLAAVAVERGEPDRAQAHLDAATEDRTAAGDPVTEAGRALAAARLHLAREDPGAALEAVERIAPVVGASPWVVGQTALVVSAAHLAEGRPRSAAGVWRGIPEGQPACVVEAARVRLALGEPEAALDLLDRMPAGGCGAAITVRAALVRAQAVDRTGDVGASRRLVARALREARRERLRRPFLDAGPWIRPYLGMAELRALAAGWLVTGPPPPDAYTTPPAVVEELSGRERDVLRRLAQMMSTEEVAADLYVSVNTVKTHLKSAYRKLAVNRRQDAVRRARERGLI